ncbi:MAG: ABC transporter substrate-binding protein [Trueperaceae bacterium]
MNYRKYLLTLLLAPLLLVGSVGVSQSSSDAGAPLDPSVSGDVEFWHFWGSPVRRTAVRRVVALCEAELPNVNVTEVFKPWGDIWTANIAAVAAGSGMPDVIVADRNQLPREAAEGIYENLSGMSGVDGVDSDGFWEFTWNQSMHDGDPYGIPFETDVRVLFYNKTLFEAAGLDPENPPATWEELEAAADAIDQVEANGNLERIGFSPLIGNGPPNIWALNNGHNWLNDDGEPVVNDPAVVETGEWIKSWVDRYGGYANLQRFTQSFGAPPNDHFMSGAVAMKVDTAGYASVLNFYRPRMQLDGNAVEIDWGVAPIPAESADETTSDSGGFTLSIPAGADNQAAAWEFIKCATNPSAQTSWARDTFAIPNGPASANAPELMADPNWAFYIDAIEAVPGDNSTFVPAYPAWQNEINNRWESVWSGDMSVEEALQQAQQAIDSEIANQ